MWKYTTLTLFFLSHTHTTLKTGVRCGITAKTRCVLPLFLRCFVLMRIHFALFWCLFDKFEFLYLVLLSNKARYFVVTHTHTRETRGHWAKITYRLLEGDLDIFIMISSWRNHELKGFYTWHIENLRSEITVLCIFNWYEANLLLETNDADAEGKTRFFSLLLSFNWLGTVLYAT